MQVVGVRPIGINLKICLSSRYFDRETGSERQDNRTVALTTYAARFSRATEVYPSTHWLKLREHAGKVTLYQVT